MVGREGLARDADIGDGGRVGRPAGAVDAVEREGARARHGDGVGRAAAGVVELRRVVAVPDDA